MTIVLHLAPESLVFFEIKLVESFTSAFAAVLGKINE
jgi:hypothetical protein